MTKATNPDWRDWFDGLGRIGLATPEAAVDLEFHYTPKHAVER